MACAECSLSDLLEGERLPRTVLHNTRLLGGVARGMAAVHRHELTHLDLKPSNVLVSAEGIAWITDFGLSATQNVASATRTANGRGTTAYKPPEHFDHREPESYPSDVDIA